MDLNFIVIDGSKQSINPFIIK